jgi:hypothetical protein
LESNAPALVAENNAESRQIEPSSSERARAEAPSQNKSVRKAHHSETSDGTEVSVTAPASGDLFSELPAKKAKARPKKGSSVAA